jgi:hypothetical protein
MLLAEFEVWHSRPRAPTRRLALGHLMLPVDPAPGFGGLLLGAVVAAHVPGIDDDLLPDLHRLIEQVDRGERVVQPRLRNRYQVDRHGLARSVHRMVGEGEHLLFEFDTHGTELQQVLAAIYAVERLEPALRHRITTVVRKGLAWRGPVGPSLISHLAGSANVTLSSLADPRAWALEILGFPAGTVKPSKQEVMALYRSRLRQVHPDYGGDTQVASSMIGDLGEARRILLTT